MESHQTKDGIRFIVRCPKEEDAENIIWYSKTIFASTDQLLTMPEEYTITVPQEKVWINNLNQNPDTFLRIAEVDKQIIGLLFFIPNSKKKQAHTGEFGVTVHPAYQGKGIGRMLVERLMHWAKENPRIEKVGLNVFDTNENAIRLYRSLGFIEEGRLVKAVKQPSGEYADLLQMYAAV